MSTNSTSISFASQTELKPPIVWGYPDGTSIVDLVPLDMIEKIHPHWKQFPPINPMWHYILGVIYIFLGATSVIGMINHCPNEITVHGYCLTSHQNIHWYLLSLIGNSLVLYLFSKTKDLRTPANMFVVNLAFSDLCMMLTQFPLFVLNCFGGGVWLFGPFLCELYACTGSVFGLCSICTMAAISYDRYNVIVNGMNGPRMTSGSSISS